MKFVLDTNRYSDMARNVPEVVAVVRAALEIYIPVIVLGELKAGFKCGTREEANEAALALFLSRPNVRVLYLDLVTADVYGTLEAELRDHGTPIPTNDVWIAALAVQHTLKLYTRDTHFKYLRQVVML